MSFDPLQLAVYASWVATGLGAGLWLWSWLREKDAIRKLRFLDCGVVLLFASILLRIVTQTRVMSVWDWAMILVGPLFIAAALWRLARRAHSPRGR